MMRGACDARAGHCACRDCRAVVLGPLGTLCEDCREASCDAFYTPCHRPGAYAPRPRASCPCCAGDRLRAGRPPRALCADCRAAGCEWHHAECIRSDLGEVEPPSARHADDLLVCLECGGQVAALGDDLCSRCAGASRLPRIVTATRLRGATLAARIDAIYARFRSDHPRGVPTRGWVLRRLDEACTTANETYDALEAREMVESRS